MSGFPPRNNIYFEGVFDSALIRNYSNIFPELLTCTEHRQKRELCQIQMNQFDPSVSNEWWWYNEKTLENVKECMETLRGRFSFTSAFYQARHRLYVLFLIFEINQKTLY